MPMTTISFARHHFPPVIIQHAVWLYVRFTLRAIATLLLLPRAASHRRAEISGLRRNGAYDDADPKSRQ
jgi:hypothetical protein